MCVFQKSKEELRAENQNLMNGKFNNNAASNNHVNKSNNNTATATPPLAPFKSMDENATLVSEPNTYNNGSPLTINDLKFNVKLNELKELMQLKGEEAVEKLNSRHGGLSGLAAELNTNLTTGIDDSEEKLKRRVEAFGRNQIPPKAPKSFIKLAFEAVQDTTLVMLIVCSIISIGLSFYHPDEETGRDEDMRLIGSKELGNLEWVEGAAIMVAVVVVVFVTAFNDWRKEKQFRGLKDRIESNNVASVVRAAQIKQINVKDLVVGDICCIKYGDLIPADGVVVNASDLKIDESSLTGETDLIKKNCISNITLLSG
jgi:Ca2+ transporting ATPase